MATSVRATFRRRFFAGLLALIPIAVTLSIIGWFVSFVDGLLKPLYYRILGYHIPGLGFISAVVLIFIVGVISMNVLGRRVIEIFDKIMLKIPVFKSIYTAIKQLIDAFSPESRVSSFKKFVIVEYPRPGVFAFGFLIKECVIAKERGGHESRLKAVYIPSNHLYFGEIALFRDEDIFYTSIPMEEGIKIMLSTGIVIPERISESE